MKAFVILALVFAAIAISCAQVTHDPIVQPPPPVQDIQIAVQEIEPSTEPPFLRNAEWHQALAAWTTALIALVTLWVVYRQLTGLNTQMRSAALQGIWTAWIDIDKWFIEHHQLRRYYYESGIARDPTDPTTPESKLDCVSEMLLDCYANIYAQREVLGVRFDRLGDYMRTVYRHSPVLRDFVDRKAAPWYDRKFIDYLRS